jgi:hypothetical protein
LKDEATQVAIIGLPNVRDDVSPLASGVIPAQAGNMTEVPKAW